MPHALFRVGSLCFLAGILAPALLRAADAPADDSYIGKFVVIAKADPASPGFISFISVDLQKDHLMTFQKYDEAPKNAIDHTATGTWKIAGDTLTITLKKNADGSPIDNQDIVFKVSEEGKKLTETQFDMGTFTKGLALPATRPAPGSPTATRSAASSGLHVKYAIKGPDRIFDAAFGRDGQVLMMGTQTGSAVSIWDMKTGKLVGPEPAAGNGYWPWRISPDQKYVAAMVEGTAVGPQGVELLNPTTGKLDHRIGTKMGFGDLAWTKDGKRLAVASGKEIEIWDVATNKLTVTVKAQDPVIGFDKVAFSIDGKSIASMGKDTGANHEFLNVWDAATGRQLKNFPCKFGNFLIYLDDKTVLIPGDRQDLVAMDITGNALVAKQTYSSQSDILVGAAISPNGKWIAGTTSRGVLRIWDAATRRIAWTTKDATDAAFAMAFSADSKMFALGDYKGGIWVWDVPDQAPSPPAPVVQTRTPTSRPSPATRPATVATVQTPEQAQALAHVTSASADMKTLLVDDHKVDDMLANHQDLLKDLRDLQKAADAVVRAKIPPTPDQTQAINDLIATSIQDTNAIINRASESKNTKSEAKKVLDKLNALSK